MRIANDLALYLFEFYVNILSPPTSSPLSCLALTLSGSHLTFLYFIFLTIFGGEDMTTLKLLFNHPALTSCKAYT